MQAKKREKNTIRKRKTRADRWVTDPHRTFGN